MSSAVTLIRWSVLVGLLFGYAAATAEPNRQHLRQARQLREAGKPAAALKLLRPYDGFDRKLLDEQMLPLFLEQLRCQQLVGSAERAAKQFEFATDNTTGWRRAMVVATRGDMALDQKALPQAAVSYKAALQYGDDYYRPKKGDSVARVAVPGHENWPPVRQAIAARLASVRKLMRPPKKEKPPAKQEADLASPAYDAYVAARKLQQSGKLPAARKAWAELRENYKDTVFGEAAAVYGEACALAMNDDRAVGRLRALINDDPKGLYRGEALRLIAEYELRSRRDAAAAAKAYDRCLSWCNYAESLGTHPYSQQLPASVAKKAAPPPESRKVTDAQQVESVPMPATALLNRDAAAYYLRDLKRECRYSLGLLAFHAGDFTRASTEFGKATALDPVMMRQEKNWGATIVRRLKAACGIKFMVAEPAQLARIPNRWRLPLLLADFLLLTDRYREAIAAYTELMGESGSPPELRAACLMGSAHAYHRLGQGNAAKKQLLRIDREFSRTETHAMALYALGIRDDYSAEEQDQLLLRAYKLYPNSFYGQRAYFSYGMNRRRSAPEQFREVMTNLIRKHPRSKWVSAAKDVLNTD